MQLTEMDRRAKTVDLNPKYTQDERDKLRPPELFPGMWIYNTDKKRPEKFTPQGWVPPPALQ